MKSNSITNPTITLQSDWYELIRRPTANLWLTSKTISQNSVHKTIAFKDQKPIDCEDFDIIFASNNCLQLVDKESHLLSSFLAPIHVFSSIHQKSVSSLDVTNGQIGVSVAADNKLRVWDTNDGSVRRDLIGHVFEPYFCRFFPSGEVILSGGADMQLKIWSAVTGKCAATLIGHKRAVFDSAFVDRGRNFITVSRDGSAKLWDCSSQTCIENIIQLGGETAINTCALQSVGNDLDIGVRQTPVHEKAVGTDGKLLLMGTETGIVYGIGLNSNQKIFELKCNSAINLCRFLNEYHFIYGSQSGGIELIDVRSTDRVLKSWETSSSPVRSLLPLIHSQSNGFLVGRSDGSAVYHYLDIDNQTIQLSGSDFESINCMASDGTHVFTACRDGMIRKYNMKAVSEGLV